MRFMTTNAFVVITAMPFEQRAPKYVSSYLVEISDTCLALGAKKIINFLSHRNILR